MGSRKKEMADRLKEIKKVTAIAKLNDVPTSPRKMRLVADMIRGVEVNRTYSNIPREKLQDVWKNSSVQQLLTGKLRMKATRLSKTVK